MRPFAAALAVLVSGAAHADLLPNHAEPVVSPIAPVQTMKLSHDAAKRMTVPVTINGSGPYNFVIDTGADRSVVSGELAAKLGLPPGPIVLVRSTCDEREEPSVVVATMGVGKRRLDQVRAPLLPAASLGADGMLGIDALRGQRIAIDFMANHMSLSPAAADPIDPGAVVVEGRNRYGQLILLDASVENDPVFVILDTGAETSVVNSTFRRKMEDGRPASDGHSPARILSVTGGTSEGQFGHLTELTLGSMTLHDLPIVFADLYTFKQFHLERRPAMLLGMDVLRVFDRVEIDYPNRHVTFHLNAAS